MIDMDRISGARRLAYRLTYRELTEMRLRVLLCHLAKSGQVCLKFAVPCSGSSDQALSPKWNVGCNPCPPGTNPLGRSAGAPYRPRRSTGLPADLGNLP